MELLLFLSENNFFVEDLSGCFSSILDKHFVLSTCKQINTKNDFLSSCESAKVIYVIRIHEDVCADNLFSLPAGWIEEARELCWEKETIGVNYSIIKFVNNPTCRKNISVIISTYNQPLWLEKTLWGYSKQSISDFELIIADDGSSKDTYLMLQRLAPDLPFLIKHVWHEDVGFRKCDILNKAILSSQADYLLFSDGDCIPRKDFVESHALFRTEGRFLSGGYHKLDRMLSDIITKFDIVTERCFDLKWLKSNGMKNSFRNNKLTAKGIIRLALNTLTPTKPTWNGHNSSGWRSDILAVNGFDERMKYGGQDREFGERLVNYGVRGKQIRYTAICLHLDHPRNYRTRKSIEFNNKLRKVTRLNKNIITQFGIVKYL